MRDLASGFISAVLSWNWRSVELVGGVCTQLWAGSQHKQN